MGALKKLEDAATEIFQPVEKAISKTLTDIFQPVEKFVNKNAAVIAAVALSVALPGIGSAIGSQLMAAGIVTGEAAATYIGTAIASTAAQVAQGVPIEQALKNSIVTATVSGYSPAAAKEINAVIGNPAVSDMITSAGASALKTAAAGGTEQDIINNMTGALAGSAASSAYQLGGEDYTRSTGRVLGSAVAGGVTGGVTGALAGAAGELGSQAKADVSDTLRGIPLKSEDASMAGGVQYASLDTGVVSDAGNPKLQDVVVTAQRPPLEITSTDIIDTPVQLDDVTITNKREETPLNVAEVEKPAAVEEPAAVAEEKPEEKPAEDKPYKPNLFILGGKQPKAPTKPTSTTVLGQALGTTTGLTSSRGAGEIEGPSTGKKRKKVWNEETLRLKDALGV